MHRYQPDDKPSILFEDLILGDADHAEDIELLRDLKVDAILNIAKYLSNTIWTTVDE